MRARCLWPVSWAAHPSRTPHSINQTMSLVMNSLQIVFVIEKPDVYKNPSSETYVVFGVVNIEDQQTKLAQAAEQFRYASSVFGGGGGCLARRVLPGMAAAAAVTGWTPLRAALACEPSFQYIQASPPNRTPTMKLVSVPPFHPAQAGPEPRRRRRVWLRGQARGRGDGRPRPGRRGG